MEDSEMKYAKTAEAVSASPIRDMMTRAAKLGDAVSFSVGEPDFFPSQEVIDATQRAADEGYVKYSPGAGFAELRQAYAEYLSGADLVSYSAEEVIVTAGGMAALFLGMKCLLDPGDEVLIASPYFSNYAQMVMLCGGETVPVNVYEKDDFVLTPEAVETAVTPRSKVLLLNSPCNPTGGVLSPEATEKLAKLAIEHDLFVVSDEVYRSVLFDGASYTSIASLPGMKERTLIVDSCSKTFAMTGYRVGFGAGPRHLINLMTKLTEGVYSCVSSICQLAAVAALREGPEHLQMMVREYEKRRDYICGRIDAIRGLSCIRPKGAFYLFVNIGGTGLKAKEYSDRLLDEYHVAVVPGDNFGTDAGDYIRISYATSMEQIIEGCDRMERFSNALFSEQPCCTFA
jgi:Aspartate/tyrosine/aromatic aminotransferase